MAGAQWWYIIIRLRRRWQRLLRVIISICASYVSVPNMNYAKRHSPTTESLNNSVRWRCFLINNLSIAPVPHNDLVEWSRDSPSETPSVCTIATYYNSWWRFGSIVCSTVRTGHPLFAPSSAPVLLYLYPSVWRICAFAFLFFPSCKCLWLANPEYRVPFRGLNTLTTVVRHWPDENNSI